MQAILRITVSMPKQEKSIYTYIKSRKDVLHNTRVVPNKKKQKLERDLLRELLSNDHDNL